MKESLANERAAIATLFETPSRLVEDLQSVLSLPATTKRSWAESSYDFIHRRWVELIGTPIGLPVRRRAAAQTLRIPDSVLALVDTPPPWTETMQDEFNRWRERLNPSRLLLTEYDNNPIAVLVPAGLRTHRRLVLNRLALRVKWYEQRHGRFPDRLEEICDQAMPTLPTKWFEDKPFEYSTSGRSFRVASNALSPDVARPGSVSDESWRTTYGLLIQINVESRRGLPKETSK
jgi:hypothetical protein